MQTKKLSEVTQISELPQKLSFIAEADGEIVRLPQELTESKKKTMEKVLLYYGYPIAINGAWSVENAVNIYKNYDITVFGDEYNNPAHDTYSDTIAIFKKLRETSPKTRIVGYVPIGQDPGWEDSNLTMDQLKQRVDWWAVMGVDGIFLDEYGYDYYVTRERQNEIVAYCKAKGFFIFANSWSIEYVFSSEPIKLDWLTDFEPNPKGLSPLLDENDYYLYENLFYTTEKQEDNSISLECASVWRIDDVLGYYTRPKVEEKTYYEKYKTKICSLDSIPSDMDITHKNILQSISIIGAAILNITAVAFGNENWGSNGYYHEWDLPDLELATDGLNGVSVATKTYIKGDGTEESFPYKWSTNLNGHTYSVIFDIDNPDDRVWADGKRYAAANDVIVENIWMSIFDFQTTVRQSNEKANDAIKISTEIKTEVENVMPTLQTAEENIKRVVAEAQIQIDNATKQLEAGLQDLELVTAGFGFKEIQW